ncbi:protein regulator of cytokinesis 1 isoform X1 [Boleophthalmus pectinirostris]|uniref:protein regulator of cytokinesis 1 isoform X1 n=1 Tax=Boleophthalmus pectinirostris TaxID=150288 RepID=UPI000A1C4F61|nr:protein regulator of cytokinesis 1 isoform X1 [Boleophthalmus pectinirostris]
MRVSEVHAAESVAYFNRALVKLQDIWEEIGIHEEQRLQRTNEVHNYIKGLLDMMITEEEDLRKRLVKTIEDCRKEMNILCSELQLPPFEEESGCTILQREKNSRLQLEGLRNHKKQRMDEFKNFIAKDCELCDIMSTTPFSIDKDSVPSLKQLETYRAYLDDLTKEKEKRHEEFISLKEEIAQCMEDLERQPETSFEMDVMCEDEESFFLSTENISALKILLSQLKESKAEIEMRCISYRTKIQELWERLKVPQEERDPLSEHMLKTKKKNVEALRIELQRLEVLKIQSIKSVIEAIRAEIALLWEKCFYSQEQCQAFSAYQDDDFTEELLDLHEAEISKLKKCYEDHKELFDGVTKWQSNWTLYLELDKKANDPARFNNRGGNLLKEEKQRTDLQKSIPKLEKVLKTQIDSWEQENGREFLVNGQKFLDYVQQQWENHHNEKEREKLERQLKKTKQIQEDMMFGTSIRTPSKRRIAGTPTPGKMRKMNSASTLSTPTSFLGGTLCQSSIQKPPLSASKSLGLRTPGQMKTPRILERNKENISHLQRNTPSATLRSQDTKDHTFTLNPIAGSYVEFARDLTKASKSNVNPQVLNSTVSHQ